MNESTLIKKLNDISTYIANAIDGMVEAGASEPVEKTASLLQATVNQLPKVADEVNLGTVTANDSYIFDVSNNVGATAAKKVKVNVNVDMPAISNTAKDILINGDYIINAADEGYDAYSQVLLNVNVKENTLVDNSRFSLRVPYLFQEEIEEYETMNKIKMVDDDNFGNLLAVITLLNMKNEAKNGLVTLYLKAVDGDAEHVSMRYTILQDLNDELSEESAVEKVLIDNKYSASSLGGLLVELNDTLRPEFDLSQVVDTDSFNEFLMDILKLLYKEIDAKIMKGNEEIDPMEYPDLFGATGKFANINQYDKIEYLDKEPMCKYIINPVFNVMFEVDSFETLKDNELYTLADRACEMDNVRLTTITETLKDTTEGSSVYAILPAYESLVVKYDKSTLLK